MTHSQRLLLALSSTGIITITLVILFIAVPFVTNIKNTRADIDVSRSIIASLKKKQENIEEVSQNFSKIQEQDNYSAQLFLKEDTSVDFFNAVDATFESSGIKNGSVRIDTPNRSQHLQLIGIHLTLQGTYREVITFFRSLSTLPILVKIESLSISSTESSDSSVTVTADGLLPWEETP